jgi:hypothetical protein
MAEFTARVHQKEKVPNSLETRLVRVVPYVRICIKQKPPVLIQNGVYFDDGGKEMEKVPAWVVKEVAKLSPVVRDEVGLEPVKVKE